MARAKSPDYRLCPACGALTVPTKGDDGTERCTACGHDMRRRKRPRRSTKSGRERVI